MSRTVDIDRLDLPELAMIVTTEMTAYRRTEEAFEAGDAAMRRVMQAHRARYEAAQHRAAELFGSLRGWALAKRDFDLLTLARGGMHGWSLEHNPGHYHFEVDHAQYYRAGGFAAAIVAHNYNPDTGPAAALARRYGLRFEVPDVPSWYFPGHARLVVYIGPRGSARPEQAAHPPARLADPGADETLLHPLG